MSFTNLRQLCKCCECKNMLQACIPDVGQQLDLLPQIDNCMVLISGINYGCKHLTCHYGDRVVLLYSSCIFLGGGSK